MRGCARAAPTSTISRWATSSTGHRRCRCRRGWPARTTGTAGVGWAVGERGLGWGGAIGQSTLATQRVKANLFYRGLTFHRFPVIGDSLYTRTEVVGLRANSPKPGRPPTGMAALRMITIDQADR